MTEIALWILSGVVTAHLFLRKAMKLCIPLALALLVSAARGQSGGGSTAVGNQVWLNTAPYKTYAAEGCITGNYYACDQQTLAFTSGPVQVNLVPLPDGSLRGYFATRAATAMYTLAGATRWDWIHIQQMDGYVVLTDSFGNTVYGGTHTGGGAGEWYCAYSTSPAAGGSPTIKTYVGYGGFSNPWGTFVYINVPATPGTITGALPAGTPPTTAEATTAMGARTNPLQAIAEAGETWGTGSSTFGSEIVGLQDGVTDWAVGSITTGTGSAVFGAVSAFTGVGDDVFDLGGGSGTGVQEITAAMSASFGFSMSKMFQLVPDAIIKLKADYPLPLAVIRHILTGIIAVKGVYDLWTYITWALGWNKPSQYEGREWSDPVDNAVHYGRAGGRGE